LLRALTRVRESDQPPTFTAWLGATKADVAEDLGVGCATGSLKCTGQSIIGLQGRAGEAVDALGLICGKAAR
jgi:hypothetical protein